MIIWGSKGVTKTVNSGMFHCPQCRLQQDYRHQKVSRYFTLYFIPIFETEQLGEFIECQRCRGQFMTSVLEHDPRKLQAKLENAFNDLVLHLLFVMVSIDGIAAPSDLEAARAAYRRATGREASEAEVLSALRDPETSPTAVARAAREIGPNLNDSGKEALIHVALSVAGPVSELSARNRKVLADVAQAVGMTPAHFRGVVSEFNYARS